MHSAAGAEAYDAALGLFGDRVHRDLPGRRAARTLRSMARTREEIDAEKAHKPRPDLLPAHALLCAGRAMGYGYRKHGDCTWREPGTEQADPRTHIASAMRHLLEHLHDADACEEGSGLPVLWHAAAQILIAVECTEQLDEISGRLATDIRVRTRVEALDQARDGLPRAWPPEWQWADCAHTLPEGWRWIYDARADQHYRWACCSPGFKHMRWGTTPAECAAWAWKQVRV